MREIKFRGKRVRDGEWVYGDLITKPIHHECCVLEAGCINHSVMPETVGQYTGLKDKNGKEIYEGDIVQTVSRDGVRLSKFMIVWSNDGCKFMKHREDGFYFGLDMSQTLLEVIGNSHDTPTLLSPTEKM